ncbi:sensor histidine kinase [Candidatus Cyanaurora vandensis]|uniref:sensor histidine kinase n=1 Tax=Candidatus Cyanaurora vandensis TaxID=2714958 RepID=UPI00257D0DE8|nr:sensor histidine kinase [Candidatus Cyanaurora vandensis]
MFSLSEFLQERVDSIVEEWIELVRQDRQIESANGLSTMAIRDHIPFVLTALTKILDPNEQDDIQLLARASLEHGALRAEQGFDAAEIAREYRQLRWVIVNALEEYLLADTAAGVIRALRLVDTVIDEAIAGCFQSYMNERMGELQRLQAQVSLTNQELTRLVRASQNNLALLAQEVRAPLTSIIGYAELFLRQQRMDEEVRDTLPSIQNIERVLTNGQQMLRLVNDALEFSRYETGRVQLRGMEIDVRTVFNHVLEPLTPLAQARNLTLEVDYAQAPAQVFTDPFRLQQVVVILLHNAIRTTALGTIQLRCLALPNQQWSLTIRDTGQGISPEDQPYVFTPYAQLVSTDRQRFSESTGMELAIASRLVELLQGRIELVSQVGLGSSFIMTFPVTLQLAEVQAVDVEAS